MNIIAESAVWLKTGEYGFDRKLPFDLFLGPRPTFSIGHFTKGSAELISSEGTLLVREGDTTFIPRGSTYTIHYLEDTVRYQVAHFNFPMNSGCLAGKLIPMQVVPGWEDVKTLLAALCRDMDNPECVLSLMSIFYALCDLVVPKLRWEPLAKPDPRIVSAMEYLEQYCHTSVSIDELASHCDMSNSHFHVLFKKGTGMTPMEYKKHASIRLACQLLLDAPELSIEEISERCGFDTAASFRRVFRTHIGVSPREYRKNTQMIL